MSTSSNRLQRPQRIERLAACIDYFSNWMPPTGYQVVSRPSKDKLIFEVRSESLNIIIHITSSDQSAHARHLERNGFIPLFYDRSPDPIKTGKRLRNQLVKGAKRQKRSFHKARR